MKHESRSFWERQAATYKTAFEQLDELAEYVDRSERRHLFSVIDLEPEMEVLDLGCGTGRWAFEFARRCRRVVAADFAVGMIERAQQEASRRGLNNIDFRVASVEEFQTEERFDLVILSGVLVYFQDEELPGIIANVKKHLKPGGKIVSRETVGIKGRKVVEEDYHDKIGEDYSAIYRHESEYRQLFARAGLQTIYAADFTPTNFPMILYRRLVPRKARQARLPRKLLELALRLQYAADPFLLRHNWLYRPLMNRFWKIKSMLFIYGIDS